MTIEINRLQIIGAGANNHSTPVSTLTVTLRLDTRADKRKVKVRRGE